ncbi:13144_t:CDS:1, partial [Funneliformis caledonium]
MVEADVHSRAVSIIQDLGGDYDPNITDEEKRDLQDFTSTIASPLSVQVEVEIIPIHGMTCQSCVKSITNAVSSLSGIVNI